MSPGPSNVPISGSDTHSGMTLPAEQNGVAAEAVNGALSSESPDTAESMADNAGLSVPPVSPGGPESGKVPILHKTALTLVLVESHTLQLPDLQESFSDPVPYLSDYGVTGLRNSDGKGNL